jgi:periplasmic protein TonB
MSKSSIFEKNWINLVFEDRNQEYGAYQLRQESTKNALHALCIGLLFVSSLFAIPLIVNYYNPKNQDTEVPYEPDVITIKVLPKVQPPTTINKTEIEVEQTTPVKQIPAPENFVITPASQASPVTETPTNSITTKPITDGLGEPGTTTTNTSGTAVAPISTPIEPVGPVSVDILEKLPEFPGGMSKFYAFVGANFEKPDLESGQILRVQVSFVIEKDGSMTDIKVLQDPGFGLGIEAIRVLKSLKTKWIPGVFNKKSVRTAYTLPIAIQID